MKKCILFLSSIVILLIFFLFYSCSDDDNKISLTSAEREWLNRHNGTITIASDPEYPPIEFIDNSGKFSGYSPDIFSLIEKKLNCRFKRVYTGSSWEEIIEAARQKKVDVVCAITPKEDRKNFLLFTNSYFDAPIVLIVRKDSDFDGDLKKIYSYRVTTVAGYGIRTYLRETFSGLNFDLVPDIFSGLQELAFRGSDILIVDFPTAYYYIEKEGFSNLKIAGRLEYRHTLVIGSRNDWPELNSILNKALASITEKEKHSIYNKWIPLEVDLISLNKPVIRILISIALIIVIIICAFIWWNRTLKKEVRLRTREIENQRKNLEEKVKERTSELTELNNEMMIKNEQLGVLNSTKDKFFSIIAHDLINPFMALRGFSDFLSSNVSNLTQEQIKHYSELICKTSQNLYSLTENLLTWSRAQNKGIEINKGKLALKNIVEEVFLSLNQNAENRKISLVNNISGSAFVFADKNIVVTVLRNLISNGIKFSSDDTAVTVEAALTPPYYTVSVIDNGIGIDEQDLLKLFRLDSDARSIGSNSNKGTGLGLLICKEFVELNGGEIFVESAPGNGSRFSFTLQEFI
jgi:signal transduction histidine kinase